MVQLPLLRWRLHDARAPGDRARAPARRVETDRWSRTRRCLRVERHEIVATTATPDCSDERAGGGRFARARDKTNRLPGRRRSTSARASTSSQILHEISVMSDGPRLAQGLEDRLWSSTQPPPSPHKNTGRSGDRFRSRRWRATWSTLSSTPRRRNLCTRLQRCVHYFLARRRLAGLRGFERAASRG